jgi:hypothetical protein
MATRKTRAAAAVAPVAEAAAAPAVPAAAATAAVADAGTKRKAETLDQEEEEEPTFAPTAGVFGLCVCGRMRERASSCRRRRTQTLRTLAMCRLQPFHPHSLMSLVHG